MTTIDIKPTNIFKKNYLSTSPILVNRGGAGSSKSYSIAQLLTILFLKNTQIKILALRKSSTYIKDSLLKDFKDVMDDFSAGQLIKYNKTERYFSSGKKLIQLGSVDDAEKYKSTDWNYIWLEEATEFTFEEFKTLKLRNRTKAVPDRPNQVILTFNPTSSLSWIKTEILDKNIYDYTEIISSYKDNSYLPDFYVKDLQDLEKQDANFYRIYTLGEWGILENVIYSNWQVIDAIPEGGDVFYGLDFGFNNPSALVKIIVIDQVIYLQELIFESGLTNQDLIDKLNKLILNKNQPIYADSAEPQRIEEISRAVFNIHPANKSVKDGIDFVKRQKLMIEKDSVNLIKELQTYSYRKDKNNNVLDEPIKFNDHALDAMRYGIYTHLGSNSEPNYREFDM